MVNAGRIGIWRLVDGGFFTLIAMTDRPTLFRTGVDVAGVVDYRMDTPIFIMRTGRIMGLDG